VQQIKNIIFDLGGVIINLDMKATRDAFIALGAENFDTIYTQAGQTGIFDRFDKGEITPAEFRNELRKHIPRKVTDEEIDGAWDAMLLDVPKAKLELLSHLGKKYRLFLLSNTNVIHVKNFSAELQRVHGTPDFSPYFEKWYYSCNIGMRKPDAEIFEFVLNENHLKAEETLFIDDSVQHIQGASLLGIQTLLLGKHADLAEELTRLGLL
jgi:FMN phosphatase YigB (HAD superfamily)